MAPTPGSEAVSENKISSVLLISTLLFQQVLGGLTFPISKYGLEQIEPFTFAFFRFVISAAVLFTIVRMRRHKLAITGSDRWRIVGLGVLIIPFNQVMYLYGQKLTAAGHGALLFATAPLWVFLAAVIHLHEKLVWRRALGIVIGIAGVATIMWAGAKNFGPDYLSGDLIILIAVLAWVYYTILGRPLVRKYGALRVTAYALGSGTLLYIPYGLYSAIQFDYSQTTIGGWLSVLYLAIGTSVLAYVMWYWVLKYMEASRIAVFHNLQPVLAAGIAHLMIGEEITTAFVVGSLVALCGVIIAEV
jgi:drug/metabolite transporter (DMT)-like permease